jgi:hypothetical protein
MDAELDCVICSGPLKGRQHTYALFDERVPATPARTVDEALAELVLRYFTSRGPATAKDLRFWSSLTLADIHRGLEMAAPRLEHEVIEERSFWSATREPPPAVPSPRLQLLQGLDEYFVGYGESRSFCHRAPLRPTPVNSAVFNGAVILDSQLAGHWKRTLSKRVVAFQVALRMELDDAQMQALHDAAERQGAFLGVPTTVQAEVI